jgi:K+-transporting ATPase ATPase A chain
LYGLLVFAIIAVFVAGLMVGRTPEYLGKKIEAYEMKMAAIVILIPPAVVLLATALAVSTTAGKGALYNADFPYTTVYNTGPHGFSEALYAYSSQGNNNGSAFAGFGANNPFHNLTGGVVMFFARYWVALPSLAIAGSLVRKKKVPPSAGTLPTHTPLFVGWIVGVVIIVGALSFLPALALGPIVEQLLLAQGATF